MTELDTSLPVVKWDAKIIVGVLRAMHDPRQWAFFDELRIGTGFGKDAEQRFDGWAIHYYPSKRNVTRCYEIKISKNDFLNEINKPLKRRAGLRLANEFWFVAPQGLLDVKEIPPECGLMEVDKHYQIHINIQAPFRDVMPPTWLFVSALSRRWDKPRFEDALSFIQKQALADAKNKATMTVIEEYINKWKNFNLGSREIPDKILNELMALEKSVKNLVADEESF
jgi:hypothetical protein